jgi:hypothetical protein
MRSLVLGGITAAGSLGALLSAPLAQGLIGILGWRAGVLGFVVLALGMPPASWLAGRVDSIAPGVSEAGVISISGALGAALALHSL